MRTPAPIPEHAVHRRTCSGRDGDGVVVRWIGRGTHSGQPLMGVPANGAPVTASGVYVFRIVDGKIVEAWDNWDNLNVMQQLGGSPAPS